MLAVAEVAVAPKAVRARLALGELDENAVLPGRFTTQPTEYTRVSLDLSLRPHEFQHAFNPPKDTAGLRRQVVDFRTVEATELMRAGWTTSQEPVTKPLGAGPRSPEIDLRGAGKWGCYRREFLTTSAV